MALLREVPITKGLLSVNQNYNIAYVEQIPVVFSGKLQDLITFGLEYKEDLFAKVIAATGLVEDIDLFHDGINTIIGERGINLSGG